MFGQSTSSYSWKRKSLDSENYASTNDDFRESHVPNLNENRTPTPYRPSSKGSLVNNLSTCTSKKESFMEVNGVVKVDKDEKAFKMM